MTRKHYPMGSISSGTMRKEDLIPAFVDELEYQALYHTTTAPTMKPSGKDDKYHIALCERINEAMENDGYFDGEDSDFDLEELFDALNEYSAPYFYFGAHPGDGSDYGWWLDIDAIDATFDGLKVPYTEEIPEGYEGEALVESDHGNLTLYFCENGKCSEIWSMLMATGL